MATRTRPHTQTATAPVPTVAIYTRLSSDPTGEGAAVARQEQAARLLARAKDWPVAALYCDNDRSATGSRKREDFERLITDIESGKVQAVIVWHLDRLVRKMSDLVRIIEAGQDRKLHIACVHGVSLDMGDPTGVAVAQILTAIAAMEVAHKGARQRASNEQRAQAGRQSASRCFGYNADGTVRETEAVLVKDVFARFATGESVASLARYLTASGMRSATRSNAGADARWSRRGVINILENRRYVGEVWYRGEYVRDGVWTALVDKDLFAACAAKLADPTRKTSTGPNRRHLGPGLYRCGTCAADTSGRSGRGLLASSVTSARDRHGNTVRYRYLICDEHRTRPGQHLYVRMDKVDEYVATEIVARLNDPKARQAWAADKNVSAARVLSDELVALRGREDALALDQLADDPDYTPRQVKIMTAKLNQRMTEIESLLADLGQRSALAELARAADPGAAWRELDVFRAAEVVDALCTVTVHHEPSREFVAKRAVKIVWRQSES